MSSSSYEHLRVEALYNVTGLVALITGGGTGIGLMIAQGLAVNGAKVYIAGRRKDVLEKAIGDIGSGAGEIVPLVMDVTDKTSITRAAQEIEAREGKLHILINNAGQVGPVTPAFQHTNDPMTLGQILFESEEFEDWSKLFTVNLASIFFVTMAFLHLLEKGSLERLPTGYSSTVINITSISGAIKLSQNHFAYNASKAAAMHLSKMLATEFALKGVHIRVNDIAPGVYASEMTSQPGRRFTPEETDAVGMGLRPLPAARDGSEGEMAATALYLASPAGAYVNGQTLVIDGGYVATNPAVM